MVVEASSRLMACNDCAQPAAPGRTRCVSCAQKARDAAAELRAERRRKRLCVTCGAPVERVASGPRRYYMLCERHRAYYAERKEKARRRRISTTAG